MVVKDADISQASMAEIIKYNNFLNISLDLIAIADTDGYFKKINSAWKKTLGWTPEELLSKPFVNFVHPDDVEATISEIERQKNGETVIQFENRYRCRDGSYRWLEWTASPETDGLIFAVARDKTEQKRIQLERDRFFHISIDLLVIANTDGTFKKVNYRWEEIFGWDQDELINRPFFDFVHPDDIESTLLELEREKKGERVSNFENRYRCKDGSYRWLAWTTQPEPDGTIYAVARDITENKRMEEQLRRSQKMEAVLSVADPLHHNHRIFHPRMPLFHSSFLSP